MIKTKNISEMLTSLIEEYRFNKNTLSKYLEITEETIDGVVMGNVECLLDDPALRLKILSKAGFLYFGAIEDKDKQLSGFLEVLVSYHGISKLTIAKMADVEEQDIDRLLANPPEKVEIEVKYKIAVTVMEVRFWLKDCELPIKSCGAWETGGITGNVIRIKKDRRRVADWCLLLTFRLWGYVAIRLLKCCITICFRVFLVGIITIKAR